MNRSRSRSRSRSRTMSRSRSREINWDRDQERNRNRENDRDWDRDRERDRDNRGGERDDRMEKDNNRRQKRTMDRKPPPGDSVESRLKAPVQQDSASVGDHIKEDPEQDTSKIRQPSPTTHTSTSQVSLPQPGCINQEVPIPKCPEVTVPATVVKDETAPSTVLHSAAPVPIIYPQGDTASYESDSDSSQSEGEPAPGQVDTQPKANYGELQPITPVIESQSTKEKRKHGNKIPRGPCYQNTGDGLVAPTNYPTNWPYPVIMAKQKIAVAVAVPVVPPVKMKTSALVLGKGTGEMSYPISFWAPIRMSVVYASPAPCADTQRPYQYCLRDTCLIKECDHHLCFQLCLHSNSRPLPNHTLIFKNLSYRDRPRSSNRRRLQ
ncbi:hypothetical protein Pelo_17384 [Pelomyxa schiedti]|nr:hypothetical protein Pelo_17384 [Pelomyxa schiedti]